MPGRNQITRADEALFDAEQIVVVAGLHCSAEAVRSVGLSPSDFVLPTAGQAWHQILQMECPSQVILARVRPDLIEDVQRWIGLWCVRWDYKNLIAHASVVRRASEQRQQKQRDIKRLNDTRGGGGVTLEYEEA